MAETYCGKNCAECADKEALACPGCKNGPGKQYGGDCRLARCCREKGHQECTTCSFYQGCGTRRSKDSMPEHRLKAIRETKRQAEALTKRAPVLGKWLWVLFWLVIPATIASLMSNETVNRWLPAVSLPGLVLSAVCSLLYGVILIKLGKEEKRYRVAGICALVCAAVNVMLTWVSGGAEAPGWTLLISLPAAVLTFVGEYHEYTAHAAVLDGLDWEQADKWAALWRWYIGMYGAVFGSLLVILLFPILGLLVALGGAIGLAVVGIVKLVYLYRTAQLFKQYKIADTE